MRLNPTDVTVLDVLARSGPKALLTFEEVSVMFCTLRMIPWRPIEDARVWLILGRLVRAGLVLAQQTAGDNVFRITAHGSHSLAPYAPTRLATAVSPPSIPPAGSQSVTS